MTSNRTILITGVTGHQGGAVAQELQDTGFHLRGLTRMPDSERAAALASQGVDVRLDVWTGMPHGFPAIIGAIKASTQALDAIGLFLTERLQAGT